MLAGFDMPGSPNFDRRGAPASIDIFLDLFRRFDITLEISPSSFDAGRLSAHCSGADAGSRFASAAPDAADAPGDGRDACAVPALPRHARRRPSGASAASSSAFNARSPSPLAFSSRYDDVTIRRGSPGQSHHFIDASSNCPRHFRRTGLTTTLIRLKRRTLYLSAERNRLRCLAPAASFHAGF